VVVWLVDDGWMDGWMNGKEKEEEGGGGQEGRGNREEVRCKRVEDVEKEGWSKEEGGKKRKERGERD
jgi:hypothetical protein